jgi:hypothetical protein
MNVVKRKLNFVSRNFGLESNLCLQIALRLRADRKICNHAFDSRPKVHDMKFHYYYWYLSKQVIILFLRKIWLNLVLILDKIGMSCTSKKGET